MTIEQAARMWVRGFNAIPRTVVEKLTRLDIDSVQEITPGGRDEDSDFLPLWNTMWTFGDPPDDFWLQDEGGLEIMAEYGFRIYEQEDFGYIFGIDGAGYDFMSAHWLPLYKARGLCWHDVKEAE